MYAALPEDMLQSLGVEWFGLKQIHARIKSLLYKMTLDVAGNADDEGLIDSLYIELFRVHFSNLLRQIDSINFWHLNVSYDQLMPQTKM